MVTALFVSGLHSALFGWFALRTISSAVSSMSKPKREDGAYAFWYRFLHSETGNLDALYQALRGKNLPDTANLPAGKPEDHNTPTNPTQEK